eukprot:gene27013-48502_t
MGLGVFYIMRHAHAHTHHGGIIQIADKSRCMAPAASIASPSIVAPFITVADRPTN